MSIVVLAMFAALTAVDAGHPDEDSIRDVWIAAAHACPEPLTIVDATDSPPQAIAIPVSVEWSPCY